MSHEADLRLAWRKVEEAEKALDHYLISTEYDPDRHRQLTEEVKTARDELVHQFAVLYHVT